MADNEFARALRVLNKAATDCDIASVREKIAAAVDDWNAHVRGRTSLLPQFLQVVSSSQSYVPSDKQGRVAQHLIDSATRLIGSAVQQEAYDRAHRYCRAYPRYTDRTFELNYYCATAAEEAQAYTDAISSYRWLLDNWADDQSFIQWNQAAQSLTTLYLQTTRFDRAYEIAKRLTIRTGSPQHLLSGLLAMRGRLLEPIVRSGQILFDGVTPDPALQHVREEMSRIKFPPHVEGVYLMTGDRTLDVAFYGTDAVHMPSEAEMTDAEGSASLLRGTRDGRIQAWMVSPIDAGHFVVQFSQETVSEENVMLEGIMESVQDDARWQGLRDHQIASTNTVTGSAVATILGASHLNGGSLEAYNDVFDTLKVLQYYCVQNSEGDVVNAHQFSRRALGYSDDVWRQSSSTPALYHHELALQDQSVYEVVWPTYDGDQWSGVIRIGINNENE